MHESCDMLHASTSKTSGIVRAATCLEQNFENGRLKQRFRHVKVVARVLERTDALAAREDNLFQRLDVVAGQQMLRMRKRRMKNVGPLLLT